jgi:hypothetical protein
MFLMSITLQLFLTKQMRYENEIDLPIIADSQYTFIPSSAFTRITMLIEMANTVYLQIANRLANCNLLVTF